jgi:Protein of unknown function (DUF2474)
MKHIKQLAWFIGIWAASVLALIIIGGAIKLVLQH